MKPCRDAGDNLKHQKRPIYDDGCCKRCYFARRRRTRSQGRASSQKVNFGLSADDVRDLKAGQRRDEQGKPLCAICPNRIGVTKEPATDHDHAHCSGAKGCRDCVRGYLCSTCNRWLGHIGDDVQTCLRAALYLVDPPAQKILNPGD